jgi:hypothetical protein
MVIEILDEQEGDGVTVSLRRSNYRPGRTFVELEWVVVDEDDEPVHDLRCVGFSDHPDEAQRMFDAVVRTMELLQTGDCDDADWAELPPGWALD